MSDESLPAAQARKRYLIFLAVRLAGLAIMFGGVWLMRDVGQVPGLIAILIGGATLLIRPRHLGLTRK